MVSNLEKFEEILKTLDEWKAEYCPGANNIYLGNKCPDGLFGKTYDMHTCYNIAINNKIPRYSLFFKLVLWHEFCHVWDHYVSGSFGHGMKWIKKYFAKPLYAIGIYFMFPVVIYYMVRK